jgi:hypothetical protein
VYRFDAQTRGMTGRERLLYHQTNSKPILDELQKWIQSQFDERLVEPNSRLGDAMKCEATYDAGAEAPGLRLEEVE